MSNTAIGAKKNELIFKNGSHRKFYEKWLPKCRHQDVYHKALIYCLGLNEDTRNHITEIYNFESGYVQTECLQEGWITSGAVKVIRMAFNLSGGISLAEMSESAGESRKTIQRLIYLSNLTEELLELIDNKKIGIAQGVDLAFIPKEEQDVVFRVMQKTGVFINMEQSARVKNAVKEGLFNEQWLLEILSYKKPPVRKVVFNQNKLDSYFEPNMTNEDIEGIIVKLLEEWKMKGGQV